MKRNKLQKLLTEFPRNVVLTTALLKEHGFSTELLRAYKDSGWLESLGYGAVQFANQKVSYEGALYALQQYLHIHIHIGAKSALNLLGRAHYLELNQKTVSLFTCQNQKLPKWFCENEWDVKPLIYRTNLFKNQIGTMPFGVSDDFEITISSPERAMLECFYLAPDTINLKECFELMEGLYDLRPDFVQKLLENCNSIKAKRLFLVFADKLNHPWFTRLNLSKIDIGRGKRSIQPGGKYIEQYKTIIDEEIFYDSQEPEI